MKLTKNNYNEVKEYLIEKQKYLCPICNKKLNWHIDIHHAKVHNTEWSKNHTQLLLNDTINLIALHHNCHINNANYGRISDFEAEQLEENLLMECEYLYIEIEFARSEDMQGNQECYESYYCLIDRKECWKQCCK
jgi:hypothetical protein